MGVVESSSLCRLPFRCSSSNTYAVSDAVQRMAAAESNTFFCSRTTLVHFFSRRPSYFFRVVSSKLAGILVSSRNAAAAFDAPMTPRYATMALLLSAAVNTVLMFC